MRAYHVNQHSFNRTPISYIVLVYAQKGLEHKRSGLFISQTDFNTQSATVLGKPVLLTPLSG